MVYRSRLIIPCKKHFKRTDRRVIGFRGLIQLKISFIILVFLTSIFTANHLLDMAKYDYASELFNKQGYYLKEGSNYTNHLIEQDIKNGYEKGFELVARKAVNMAAMMNIPVIGLVENFSYFECPDCGKQHSIFGERRTDEIAEKFGLPVLAKLPIDPKTASLADKGAIELSDIDKVVPLVKALTE